MGETYASKMKLKLLYLIIVVLVELQSFKAQSFNHPSGGTSSQTITCGTTYTYYDSGGSGGNYGASESGVLVLSPSDPSQSVQIDFIAGTFNVEPNGGGCYDYIRVYNGSSISAPLIGTYCSSNLPGVIKASMNGSLTVRFTSDSGVEESGWAATVTCETTDAQTISMPSGTNTSNACTGTFYDSGGSGSPYSNGEHRILTFSPGSDVTMTFTSFSVENHSSCGYDYMSIYDGPTTSSTLIGTYCGTTSPGTVASTTGSLTILFHSDGGVTSTGWAATWNCCSVNAGSISAGTDPICNGSSTTLTLSGHSGGTSLQWQSSPNNSTWTNIGGATGSTYSASPSSDTYYRVAVTNGCTVYSSSYLLDVSNSTAGTASASTNTLCSGSSVTMSLAGYNGSIQWQSSTNGSTWSDIGGATSSTYSPSPGSDIYYRAKVTDAPCSPVYSNSEFIQVNYCVNISNGTTTNCSGFLYDDRGPSLNYNASRDYVYTINPSATVSITFNTFNVEAHSTCGYDYLEIYDGPNTSSTLIGRYCNTTGSPGTIVSSGTSLTFKWHSDSGTELSGWEAEWSCCSVNGGTSSASPSTMCVAGNATLSLSGHDGGTTIQWQSSADGVTWSNIGGATSATEVVAVSSSTYYRAKVTNGCDSYSSTNYVSVGGTPIPTNYYVNDNSTTGDVFCTNVGNAANNGRNPCSPKTSLQDIFDSYDIDPGDTIFVDAGTYTMGLNVTSSTDQGNSTSDVVIIGAGTTLTHITAPASDDNFYFSNVHYFMVRDMHLLSTQSANYNYFIYQGNDHHLYNCHLEQTAGTNVYMHEAGGAYDIDDNSVSHCEIENTSNSGYNIWIRGDADHDTIRNCVITSTGTSAKAVVLNDYYSGSHDGWPTSIHFYGNNVTADDYGIVGDVVDGNTMETYDVHDNVFNIVSSDRSDGAAVWLDDHGISSSDISNIYNNVISGGKNGIYLSSSVVYCHFYNNFICNTEYGIYVSADNSDDNDFNFNSIYSSKDCMYFTADSKGWWYVQNNILYTTGNSSYACINAGNSNGSSTFVRCDYNLYYMPGGAYAAKMGGTNYSFAGWQGYFHHDGTGNGDANSVNTDPNYRNPTSCQLDLTGNYQTGLTLGSVAVDVYGTGRTHPTIGAWEEGSTLPVVSSYAVVRCDDDRVVLDWNTLSEQNNNYFIVEGSNDGQVYSEIEIISGAGNSTSELVYSFSFDNSEWGYEYIRLSQVDFDGKYEVLKYLKINCNQDQGFELSEMYPNPTNGEVTVVVQSNQAQVIDLELIDVEGRVIYMSQQEIAKGTSFIKLSFEELAAGVYMMKIRSISNEFDVKRFVKQ